MRLAQRGESAAVGYSTAGQRGLRLADEGHDHAELRPKIVHHAPEMASSWYRVGVPSGPTYETAGLLRRPDAFLSFDAVARGGQRTTAIPYDGAQPIAAPSFVANALLRANDDRLLSRSEVIASHLLPWQKLKGSA
jgi:hypothetical protein